MILTAAVTLTGVKVRSLQKILKKRLVVYLEIHRYLCIMTEES